MQQDTRSLDAMADALGWGSIGLGALQMAAPHAVARRIGLKDHDTMLQACGVREMVTGIGLLAADPGQRPLWLWGRVAGDVMDLATLAAGMSQVGPRKRQRAALAMGAVAGVAALDALCAWKLGERQEEARMRRRRGPARNYAGRSGFPQGVAAARGAARGEVTLPADMLTPEALRAQAAL